ncbi:MAG TPA: undecaprenyl-diphosphate phosphatase [Thermoanaerobaculia bacterium]|nr:undecaprenyl-diphosphate phosphatase [Thermoanaerobaculia bacterium]
MSPLQAVVLAIVQAVTEFLPISSSGHLILVPYFLGWPDQGLVFDIATHTGTLLAILAYFWRDVRDLIVGFFTGRPAESGDYDPRLLAWWIALGTIPAGLAGLALKDWIETEARSPLLIAGTTFFYGLLLWWADRRGSHSREIGSLGFRDALFIGTAQALALVPGTSRSGVTITAALLLGFARPAAARFTFLLIIPISVLVAAIDVKDLMEAGVTAQQLVPLGIGLVVSAVVGYLVIAWLLGFLRRQTMTVFVIYRLILAAVILATIVFRQS